MRKIMASRWMGVVFITLLLVVTIVQGQDAVALTYGEPASGTVSDDSVEATFTFEGTAGETIFVSSFVVNFDFAPMIFVLRPDGALLQQLEDSIDGLLVLGPLTLPADGVYTVIVTRPDWETSGGEVSVLVNIAETTELTTDTAVEGRLPTAGSVTFFTLAAEEGDVFNFAATGTGLGIFLFSPRGDGIIFDGFFDDPGGFMRYVPSTGVYSGFMVTLSDGGTNYSLILDAVEAIPVQSGAPFSGTVRASEPVVFAFDSDADKSWRIEVTLNDEGQGQGTITIYKPDNPQFGSAAIAGDCCSGANGNPRIDPFIVPEDGTYYILLEYDDFTGEDTEVSYEINIFSGTLVSLAPGVPVSGTIEPDTGTLIYVYNGTAGERVQVTFTRTSSTGHVFLRMRSSQDDVATYLGRGADSMTFEVELPLDDLYTFEVINVDYEPSSMDFTLQLDAVEE